MEGSKLLTMIVTVTVGIIFVGALLGPVIGNYSETEKTFTNTGLYYMKKITADSDETITITWDHTSPGIITINDDDVTMPYSTNILFTINCGDNWGVRFSNSENQANTHSCDGFGSTGAIIFSANVSNESDLTGTLANGTATFKVSGSTAEYTFPYTECYYVAPTGDYVMKNPDQSAYLKTDSPIYGVGRTNWSGGSYNTVIDGTVEDISVTIINPSGWTATDTNVTYSEVSGYVDLVQFDKVTFIANTNGTPNATNTTTYSQVIVPYQVTAELSQHLDSGEIALLAVLPLMAITALLLLVVRFFTGRD